MIAGRILYVDEREIWLGRDSTLFVSRDKGLSWSPGGDIPAGTLGRAMSYCRLSRRLARAGIHHLIRARSDVVIANGDIFQRNSASHPFFKATSLVGSRPLALATNGDLICYGEYKNNADRDPVRIFGSVDGGCTWKPIYQFVNVRHVHGVFFDPYENAYWITTGDADAESGLWVTRNNFKTVELIVGGNQQYRAVQLIFTDRYIYYGSDTPTAKNFIYRMARTSKKIDRLQEVGSSVFFGCQAAGRLFFSTAIEPSCINRTDSTELWGTADGLTWQLLDSFKKDRWSHRYFQYGQILFPAGPGDNENLYFTPFATEGDQVSRKIPLADISF